MAVASLSVSARGTPSGRAAWADHMRALWVIMMVVDHGWQGYAPTFGRFWFFHDEAASLAWCDAVHVLLNAWLMPPLFFLAGLWVVPHVQRDGLGLFLKKRFFWLGVPYVAGVVFLVPLMTFPRWHAHVNPYDSFWSFWSGPFVWSALQAGPFWFLSYLLLMTTALATLITRCPGVGKALCSLALAAAARPAMALGVGVMFLAALQGWSDLVWGAPWWISLKGLADPWGKLVAVQGSRFLLQAVWFLAGAALGQTTVLQNLEARVQGGKVWLWPWCAALGVAGALYMAIAQPYDPLGAHAHEATVRATWQDHDLGPVLVRTSLQPLVCLLATVCGVLLTMHWQHRGQRFWGAVAPAAYGMYFIHEVMTVGLHAGLAGTAVPPLVKVGLATFGVLVASWGVARVVLPRVPLIGQVFRHG